MKLKYIIPPESYSTNLSTQSKGHIVNSGKFNIMITKEHRLRVKEELRKAGVTSYGLLKLESRNLPQIIHENEHVKGVSYGRASTGGGAMLVATDLRIIYFNRMPLFSSLDEVTYELVSGVSIYKSGNLFASVSLHTRAGDYTVRYTNYVCAKRFVKYIEQRCIESGKTNQSAAPSTTISQKELNELLRPATKRFLREHEVATLSTIDRNGNVDGAVVYYSFNNGLLHILTKGGTQKMHNIFAHPQVAITIFDEVNLQTMQIQALASIETDQETKRKVFKYLGRERVYGNERRSPPVTQLHEGSFIVVQIRPTAIKFRDYKKPS